MDIRPEFELQTVIKAMTDVIAPALDVNNKLAQEQAQLSIGVLNIVSQRLHLLYRYDNDELARYLALAETLAEQTASLPEASQALHALANSVESGSDVLDRARADPEELRDANFDLREKVGALITAVYGAADTNALKHVSATVTAHSKEQLLRERAWLIGKAWEADPKSVPAIERPVGD